MVETNLSTYEPNADPLCIIARCNRMLDDKKYHPSSEEIFSIGIDCFAYFKGITNWSEQRLNSGRDIKKHYNSSDLGGDVSVAYIEKHWGQSCVLHIAPNQRPLIPTLVIDRFTDGTYGQMLFDPVAVYEPYFENDEKKSQEPVSFCESRHYVSRLRDILGQHLLG